MDDPAIARLIGGAPRITIEHALRHPRFPEARRLYLERFLAVYGDDPFLVRLLVESGRFLVFLIAATLEAAHDPERRESWFTIGRLKEQMALFGLASGRHVDHLVARLCAVGFMEQQPSPEDRRIKILRTTEAMRAHDRDWIAAHYTALTVLYPEHDYSLAMRKTRDFQFAYRRVGMALLPLGAKLLFSVPDMMLFFDRAAGHMILAALLRDAMAAPEHPHAAVPYADVGDRFGVSRTHVRKLLVAAEELGLVKLHARGGRRVEILARCWESYDRGIACGMYVHDIAYLAVTRPAVPLEALPASAAPQPLPVAANASSPRADA
jgi:DNA-binding MarR family transcriptional regulator